MAQVLIRQIPEKTIVSLKERAIKNGRSLESEIRMILEEYSIIPREERATLAKDFRDTYQIRAGEDIVAMIREDRER